MIHFELKEFGLKMGLEVQTIRYFDNRNKVEILEYHFRMERCLPLRGDYIAGFKMDYNMNTREYQDACSQTLNTLRQFETWS